MNPGMKRKRSAARWLGAVVAIFALGGTALAATGGAGAGKFAAELEARAVGDPSVEACRALGEGGQKIEARYDGTVTIPAEFMPAEFLPAEFVPAEFRLPLQLSLEVVYDRATGVGAAEGTWQLGDPPTEADPPSESDPPTEADPPSELSARGELLAAVTTTESGELQLDGLLTGTAQSSAFDTGLAAVLFNFTTKVGGGATFPHLKGTVGDPSVGDPSVPANTAVLVPAVKC